MRKIRMLTVTALLVMISGCTTKEPTKHIFIYKLPLSVAWETSIPAGVDFTSAGSTNFTILRGGPTTPLEPGDRLMIRSADRMLTATFVSGDFSDGRYKSMAVKVTGPFPAIIR